MWCALIRIYILRTNPFTYLDPPFLNRSEINQILWYQRHFIICHQILLYKLNFEMQCSMMTEQKNLRLFILEFYKFSLLFTVAIWIFFKSRIQKNVPLIMYIFWWSLQNVIVQSSSRISAFSSQTSFPQLTLTLC